MRYRYTLVYRIYSMTLPPGTASIILPTGSPQLTAQLTTDVDAACEEIDKYFAIANSFLNAFTGALGPTSLEEALQAVRRERGRHGVGPYLVVTSEGDFPWTQSEDATEFEGIIADLHGPGRAALKAQFAPALTRFLAVLYLGTPAMSQPILLSDAGVFPLEDGRVIYPYRPHASARLELGYQVTPEVVQQLERLAHSSKLLKALEPVPALLADATLSDDDPLKAFLSGWCALEILVGKLYLHYEKSFNSALAAATPSPGHQRYLGRMREIMKGRVRVSDKFAVVSAALLPASQDGDSVAFKRLKKVRDDLLHGIRVDTSRLPHREPGMLARTIVLAYLADRSGAVA
jgi:hypothetical protein